MKNNLTKRFLAAAIAAASMLQGAAFAAIVTPTADTTIVNTDFEDGTPAPFGATAFEVVPTGDEGYGNALKIMTAGKGYSSYGLSSTTASQSKYMISFDVKGTETESNFDVMKVRLFDSSKSYKDFDFRVDGGKRFNPYGTFVNSKKTFVINQWYHVDILVDYNDVSAKAYVDGDFVGYRDKENSAFGLAKIAYIGSIFIFQNDTLRYDNFRISEYNDKTPIYAEKYEYAKGDKYVKVRYSESLDANTLDLANIKLVNTCTGSDEKSGEAKLAGRTLFVPVENFSFDTEYVLCLPEGTTSITGKSVANLNDYFTVETALGEIPEIAVKRVNVDFEDENNLSGFSKARIVNTEDEKHGMALKIASTNEATTGFDDLTRAQYNLTDMTRKVVIKFDVNFTDFEETDTGDYWFKLLARSKTAENKNADTYLVMYKNTFGFAAARPTISEGWNTVTLYFDYENGTVKGWLNDVYFGQEETKGGVYPSGFYPMARKNPKMSYLFDNFQVGTVAEKAKVANVRINKGSDAYGVYGLAPVAPSNITVNFTDAVLAETITSETVTLKTSDGAAVNAAITAGADGTSAVITPAVELKSNTTYYVFAKGVQTAGGNTVAEYGTSFTTETAEFKVTSFGLLNGDGDAAADFDSITLAGNAGSAYARATIQNDFGVAKTANIIFALYQGDKMVNISLTPVMVPAGETKTIGIADNISYEVPSDPTGYTLKAFIWNMADGNIASMFENVVIDK